MEVLKLEIAKLEMKPGDTLVVRADFSHCTVEDIEAIQGHCRTYLPEGCHVMLTGPSTELSVITPKEPSP